MAKSSPKKRKREDAQSATEKRLKEIATFVDIDDEEEETEESVEVAKAPVTETFSKVQMRAYHSFEIASKEAADELDIEVKSWTPAQLFATRKGSSTITAKRTDEFMLVYKRIYIRYLDNPWDLIRSIAYMFFADIEPASLKNWLLAKTGEWRRQLQCNIIKNTSAHIREIIRHENGPQPALVDEKNLGKFFLETIKSNTLNKIFVRFDKILDFEALYEPNRHDAGQVLASEFIKTIFAFAAKKVYTIRFATTHKGGKGPTVDEDKKLFVAFRAMAVGPRWKKLRIIDFPRPEGCGSIRLRTNLKEYNLVEEDEEWAELMGVASPDSDDTADGDA